MILEGTRALQVNHVLQIKLNTYTCDWVHVSKMKPDTSSTLTMEEEDVDMSGRASPAFITVENEKGVLEHVQVRSDDWPRATHRFQWAAVASKNHNWIKIWCYSTSTDLHKSMIAKSLLSSDENNNYCWWSSEMKTMQSSRGLKNIILITMNCFRSI